MCAFSMIYEKAGEKQRGWLKTTKEEIDISEAALSREKENETNGPKTERNETE